MSDGMETGCLYTVFAVGLILLLMFIDKKKLGIHISDKLKENCIEDEPVIKNDTPAINKTELVKEGIEAFGGCLKPIIKFIMMITAIFGGIYFLVKFIKWIWYL